MAPSLQELKNCCCFDSGYHSNSTTTSMIYPAAALLRDSFFRTVPTSCWVFAAKLRLLVFLFHRWVVELGLFCLVFRTLISPLSFL